MEKNLCSNDIKAKNPFLYIIKLSEGKGGCKGQGKNNQKNIKGYISPIKPRTHSKPLQTRKKANPCRQKNISVNKKPSNKDIPEEKENENEIKNLKAQLAKAKTKINDLLKENIALKATASQYKEIIDNMANNPNFMSKDTLRINDEIMNNLNNNAIPNFDEMTYEELLALEDKIGYVNRGFSKEKIDKIPFTVFVPSNNNNNSDNEKCVICQEMFTEGNKIKKLNCEHFYHQKCIDAWLSKEKNCPFCKIEVKIPE